MKPTCIKFWGCRGSIPVSSDQHSVFGGNTSCVSIECANELIVMDAGTGIRALGNEIIATKEKKIKKISIFLTHFHLDHVIGLPFFKPIFDPQYKIAIYSVKSSEKTLSEKLNELIRPPYFPVPFSMLYERATLTELSPTEAIFIGPLISVSSIPLTHPDLSFGFIINCQGRKIGYLTDHEYDYANPLAMEIYESLNVIIHDAQYTRSAIAKQKRGWGHSAWEDIVEIAKKAHVEKLFIFHHDPDATDDLLLHRQRQAQKKFPNTIFARDYLQYQLSRIEEQITLHRVFPKTLIQYITSEHYALMMIDIPFSDLDNQINGIFDRKIITEKLNYCLRTGHSDRKRQDFVYYDIISKIWFIVVNQVEKKDIVEKIARRVITHLNSEMILRTTQEAYGISIGFALAHKGANVNHIYESCSAAVNRSISLCRNNYQQGI